MIFPSISIGRMRLERMNFENFLAVHSTEGTAAPYSLWRLHLHSLSEAELRDVEDFIRGVKTRGFWSIRVGYTTLHGCLLIESNRIDWHGACDIRGWIVFSAANSNCGDTWEGCNGLSDAIPWEFRD